MIYWAYKIDLKRPQPRFSNYFIEMKTQLNWQNLFIKFTRIRLKLMKIIEDELKEIIKNQKQVIIELKFQKLKF